MRLHADGLGPNGTSDVDAPVVGLPGVPLPDLPARFSGVEGADRQARRYSAERTLSDLRQD